MRVKLVELVFGVGFGFVMAWAGLSDPVVIRNMLPLGRGSYERERCARS